MAEYMDSYEFGNPFLCFGVYVIFQAILLLFVLQMGPNLEPGEIQAIKALTDLDDYE